ncbi:hypothetical protein RvY_16359 [Ramazzottius varieornatus]|uniref:Uncharacterized protein n=1 Tax=Ramazzottius varieornatus TaxID=947166 RepID=A0A1D1VY72_RAMVA|nr:hypothetical protein RvY_16359 [Ramazzottius varieornatus]
MSGAYAPYQVPGLLTGFPVGFPFGFSLGPSMDLPLLGTLAQPRFTADEWLILQGMTASQQATAATQLFHLITLPPRPAGQPVSGSLSPASTTLQRQQRTLPVSVNQMCRSTWVRSAHRAKHSTAVASAIIRLTNVTQTETEVEATVDAVELP